MQPLSLEEKEKIKKLQHAWCYQLDESGKPVMDNHSSIERMPTAYELRNAMLAELKMLGYECERVEPSKANCIIRTFENSSFNAACVNHCFFGMCCYVKGCMGNRWVTKGSGDEDMELQYGYYAPLVTLMQDEIPQVRCETTESFYRVAKKKNP